MPRLNVRAPLLAAALVAGVASAGPVLADPPHADANAPERAGDAQDKIICKRFVETGSLVKGYRTCKSKREWDRERDNIRASRSSSGSCNPGMPESCGS